MMTMTEIISNLDEKINKLGIDSVELQSLKLFIANSIHLNESLAVSEVLESSPVTCTLVNSAISHAAGKGYSVFRGSNPRYEITNIRVKEPKSVKKFDEFITVQGYKLVYAEDYDLIPEQDTKIVIILTKKVVTGNFDALNTYSYSILDKDVSEDFILYSLANEQDPRSERNLEGTQDGSLTPAHRIKNDDSNNTIYQRTISDYGVKLLSINLFQSELKFHYKYLPYLTNSEDYDSIIDSITRIPGFVFTNESGKVEYSSPSDPNSKSMVKVNREDDLDRIYLNSLIQLQTTGVVKATSDLTNIIKNYLSNYVTTVNSLIYNGYVYIWYYTKEGNPLNLDIINGLISELKLSYYNSGLNISSSNVGLADAAPTTSISGNVIKYNSDRLLDSEIKEFLLNKMNSTVGGTFNIYEVLAEIQAKFSGIKYIYREGNVGTATLNLTDGSTSYRPPLVQSGSYYGLITSVERE